MSDDSWSSVSDCSKTDAGACRGVGEMYTDTPLGATGQLPGPSILGRRVRRSLVQVVDDSKSEERWGEQPLSL